MASASDDAWADPEGEFEACLQAGPVYGLYGRRTLESSAFPKPGGVLHGGRIGYHLGEGKHNLTLSGWQRFIDFIDGRW